MKYHCKNCEKEQKITVADVIKLIRENPELQKAAGSCLGSIYRARGTTAKLDKGRASEMGKRSGAARRAKKEAAAKEGSQ